MIPPNPTITRRFPAWLWALICTTMALLGAQNANAGRIAAFYLEPHFGAARITLNAVEIERSFIATVGNTSADYSISDFNVNLEGGIAPVGRKIFYKGSGMELGFGTGIKISGLKLGFTLTWINAAFTGVSRRYQFSATQMKAQGKKNYDSDTVPILRVLGAVKYGIPIGRVLIQFQTRIGSIIFRDTKLVLGRALERENGMTADVGIEATLRPSRWVSIGFLGYGGFFAAWGKYEGGAGSLFGGNGTICFYF